MKTTHIATCKLDSKINSAVKSTCSDFNFHLLASRRDDRTEQVKTWTYHYYRHIYDVSEKLNFRLTGLMV